MKLLPTLVCLSSIAAWTALPTRILAAEVEARPPDRLTLSTAGSRQIDVDDGGAASLNWLHYFTPDAVVGLGAEYQFIGESSLTIGSVRGSLSRGEPGSRFTVFSEVNGGSGDDDGRGFDYGVAVLGVNQAFTNRFYVELEGRYIDIDETRGTLPKLGLTYVWSPRLSTNVSYAHSVGGDLGTELTAARIDYYGQYVNLKLGGASGRADPSVIVFGEDTVTLPAVNSKQGFVGIGKTFKRGEVQLIGDYLKTGDIEKVTITLSYAAFIGSRAR